jgi:tRNA nucleotidyltransferase (CCA-adding enzyme)
VSKERIGIEVSKMIQKTPFASIELIHTLGLHSSIFSCAVVPPRAAAFSAAQILQRVSQEMHTDEILWFAAAVTPFQGLVVERPKKTTAVAAVLQDGLKVRLKTTQLTRAPERDPRWRDEALQRHTPTQTRPE